MALNNNSILAVPTNIITGFLGVGKTSTILHLMQSKPDNERWAVLVNEFGEIGIDGSLFEGRHKQDNTVFIREVPGGCMCCASGLPMQIALNQLLAHAKPDRLLIEPTGLGHPREVVEVLSSEHYQEVLLLQKTLTLVDARKLRDSRYTEHDTFNQQISIADTIIANKVDLYQPSDKKNLQDYVAKESCNSVNIVFTEHGKIELSELKGRSSSISTEQKKHVAHHHASESIMASTIPIPESGFVKAGHTGEGFQSMGWRFSPEKTFSHSALFAFLSGLNFERMKAVFITDEGVFGYNVSDDALTEIELDDCLESCIEVIVIDDSKNTINDFSYSIEADLLNCVID